MVGEEVYPAVSGKTKKDAKNEAAKLVYDMISSSKTTEVSDTHTSLFWLNHGNCILSHAVHIQQAIVHCINHLKILLFNIF